MRKILKYFLSIILFLMSLFVFFIFTSYINHSLKNKSELGYLKSYDLGEIINVDNKKVNYKIFNMECEDNTIVFIGGLGANDLSISLKPLASKINAKVVLINRPGYGLSKDSSDEADLQYIVDFYRKVLDKLEINESVYLMPHSIGGMYAMYWASLYPDQIKGIIGLDVGSPYKYVLEDSNEVLNTLTYIGSKLGIHRFIYNENSVNTAIKNYDIYDDDVFKAIWYMNMINPYSKFVLSEDNLSIYNANKVIDSINDNYRSIRKLYILSNSTSGDFYNNYEEKNLKKYYKDQSGINDYIYFMDNNRNEVKESLSIDDNTTFEVVEGPHMLYYYPSIELIDIINSFLSYN